MHRRKFLWTAAVTTGVLGGCNERSGQPETSETEMTLGANTELTIESAETIENNDEFVTDTDFPEEHVDPDASARIDVFFGEVGVRDELVIVLDRLRALDREFGVRS